MDSTKDLTIPMKAYTFSEQLTKLSGLKKIVSPLPKDQVDVQLDEIFVKEFYKAGKWKNDMIIIDAGANMGMTSIYFKDCAKMIYALEPSPASYDALVENTKEFYNIKCFPFGLGDSKRKISLRASAGDKVPDSIMGKGDVGVEIDVVGLDEFMENQGIDHVDLLKIDVEGSEYWIFHSQAFKNVSDKISHIIGESHFYGWLTPNLMKLMLSKSGFKTKFLDFDNMYDIIDYQDSDGKTTRYHVPQQTLFISER